jgi:molybdopterin synthase sulfur carrier subunit
MTAEAGRSVAITVRYFAAARAASGSDTEQLMVCPGATVEELIGGLASRSETLAQVLIRCSLLCDGVAVRDRTLLLRAGNTIDVLPPFAGG